MYKRSGNPIVEELTKSHRERSYNLSDLKSIKLDGSNRNCVWCLKILPKGKQKWCSELCIRSALAYFAPCRNHGLRVLLYKHAFKCAGCGFDYKPFFVQAYNKVKNMWYFRNPKMLSYRIENLMKAFRRLIPKNVRIEVDHVIPICLGGQGLGFDNVQILCAKCHKAKTKIDIKNRTIKNGNPRKGVKFTKEHIEALSKAREGQDSLARLESRKINLYPKLRQPILAVNNSTKQEMAFDSLEEAAKTLNLQVSNISRVLRGSQNRKQHKGWTFKYA